MKYGQDNMNIIRHKGNYVLICNSHLQDIRLNKCEQGFVCRNMQDGGQICKFWNKVKGKLTEWIISWSLLHTAKSVRKDKWRLIKADTEASKTKISHEVVGMKCLNYLDVWKSTITLPIASCHINWQAYDRLFFFKSLR